MRNKISWLLMVVMTGIIVMSCKKVVDLKPTHTIDGDEFFNSVADYEFALNAAYDRLKQNSMYAGVNGGSIFLCAVDVAGDNFYGGPANLGAMNPYFRWNYTADEASVQGGWDAVYNVIQQANITLRGLQRFRATDPLTVNRIEGQARALRAYMHFEAMRWWVDDYARNSQEPGIPYVDTFNVELMPARGTVAQTYDAMEADLKQAKELLSDIDEPIQSISSASATNRAYIDSLVCNAMLARMYLYAGEADSAIKYSSMVIAAKPLANTAEFPLIWQDGTTREVVWSIKFQAGDAALAREIYQPAGDQLSWRPVTALLNLYDPADVRSAAYWVNRNGRMVLNKYFAKTTAGASPDGVTDYKVFRTGEMYLIRAEARANKGLDASALADLNTLRSARNAATGTESGAALVAAIATERRKELVVEGHRFFDLKRTTRSISRTQNCSNFCSLGSGSRAWNLPVPQTEIIANENMEQNPGY